MFKPKYGLLEDLNINIIMIYGLIEDGILKTAELQAYKQRVQTEDGKIEEVEVTVAMQMVEAAKQGLKPVEDIDPLQMEAPAGKIVIPHPVDYGDYIGYDYKIVVDTQMYRNQIKEKKELLDSTDYQIIKCYEASLVGNTMPYDVQALHTSRQALRDEINKLQELLDK